MKNLILIALIFLLPTRGTAQNLVPNGSFETFSTCPTTFSQISNCTGWRMYHGGSSDYYNCTNATVGTPTNAAGYQVAADGVAYGGLITHHTNNYKEYLARSISPMTIGIRYEVSMSVSLPNKGGYSTDDLGVWFYDNGPTTTITSFNTALTITPQILYLTRVTDTTNWVRLTATFLADSAYDNIVIGGFGSSTTTNQVSTGFGTGTMANYGYYYIDSVVVKTASAINNLFTDSLICAGDTFSVPYSLNTSITPFFTGNQFIVQLSNVSGSFTSGVTTIGSVTTTVGGNIPCVIPTSVTPGSNYKIRIRSTNWTDSSNITFQNISVGTSRPNAPVANSNSPVCSGKPLNLTASSTTSGVTYKWTGPNNFLSYTQNPTIPVTLLNAAGSYIVTARSFGCQ